VITKHIDKNHQHLHILANLVNNNGETIKDNWIGFRGKKVAQQLTLKYRLKEAVSKKLSLINLEALNEKEANKYVVYQAILESLPGCRDLDDLKERLMNKNIETLYKYKGQTNELQGIGFKIGNFKYKGSEIDRKFSVLNLQKGIVKQRINQDGEFFKEIHLSQSLSQNKSSEKYKDFKNQRTRLNELLTPEKQPMNADEDFSPDKPKKKKSKCLHL
jgi:hypothetical protein